MFGNAQEGRAAHVADTSLMGPPGANPGAGWPAPLATAASWQPAAVASRCRIPRSSSLSDRRWNLFLWQGSGICSKPGPDAAALPSCRMRCRGSAACRAQLPQLHKAAEILEKLLERFAGADVEALQSRQVAGGGRGPPWAAARTCPRRQRSYKLCLETHCALKMKGMHWRCHAGAP